MKETLTKTDYENAAQDYRELAEALGLGKLSVADTLRKVLSFPWSADAEVCGMDILEVTKDGRIFCGDRKNPKILFENEVEWLRIAQFNGTKKGDIMYCHIDGPARHKSGNFFSLTEAEFDFYPCDEGNWDWYETVTPVECFLKSGSKPQDLPIVREVTGKDALAHWGNGTLESHLTDLSNELTDFYEDLTGLSAWHWSGESLDKDKERPMAVANRPEDFLTDGFAWEYDDWAVHKIAEALRRGIQSEDGIVDYIRMFPAIVDEIKLPGWDWEYYEVDLFRPDQMVDGKRPVPYDGTEGENKADADYSILIRAKHKPTIEEAEEWLKADIEKFKEGGVLQVVGPCKPEEVEPFYDMRNKENWPILG